MCTRPQTCSWTRRDLNLGRPHTKRVWYHYTTCHMLRRIVQHSSSCNKTRVLAHLRLPLQVRGCAQVPAFVSRERMCKHSRARVFAVSCIRDRAHTRAHASMRTCAGWKRRTVAIVEAQWPSSTSSCACWESNPGPKHGNLV